MKKNRYDTQGLYLKDIEKNGSFIIDPDNVFWGITPKSSSLSRLLPREIISLYEKVKRKADADMKDFRFKASPTAVYVDPTDRCNADCRYCYIPASMRKKGRSMTLAELTVVMEKIKNFFRNSIKKPVVIFHASEPLLVKDIIFKTIEGYSSDFYFGLQTNAILLERKDAELLVKYRVGVGISLDSFNYSTNNMVRFSRGKRGTYEGAFRALKFFDGYKGLNVITTITRFNVRHLPHIVKFLHSHKVPCVLMNPVRLTAKSSQSTKPDAKEMAKYLIKAIEEAASLSRRSKHRIVIGNFANTILAIVSPFARRLMCDISPCGGGRCFLTIKSSGDMIPCGEFAGIEGFSGGNIFRSDITKAMRSKPFKAVRRRYVEKIEECAQCELRNICGAPCPAELYALGNMYRKSVFCEFYKEIIDYAIRVISKKREKEFLRPDALSSLSYEYCLGVK